MCRRKIFWSHDSLSLSQAYTAICFHSHVFLFISFNISATIFSIWNMIFVILCSRFFIRIFRLFVARDAIHTIISANPFVSISQLQKQSEKKPKWKKIMCVAMPLLNLSCVLDAHNVPHSIETTGSAVRYIWLFCFFAFDEDRNCSWLFFCHERHLRRMIRTRC